MLDQHVAKGGVSPTHPPSILISVLLPLHVATGDPKQPAAHRFQLVMHTYY